MSLLSPEILLTHPAGNLAGTMCPLFPDPARMTWTTFSSANDNLPQIFKDQAFDLGTFIAGRRDNYCFGGMMVGLMAEISRGVMHVREKQDLHELHKSAIISVPYHNYYDPNYDRYFQQIHIKKSLKEQQKHLNDQATHFVTLPGGIGTNSEFWHTMEELRWNADYKDKTLWLVNINESFRHLLDHITAMIRQGLAHQEHFARMHVVSSVEELKERFQD